MFLDENAVPAVSPAQIEDWRRILLDAADYIEKNGWLQDGYFEYDDATGPACIVGAIVGRACYDDWIDYNKPQRKALTHLAMSIVPMIDDDIGIDGTVTCWNDQPGRTEEEVIAKLREVARS
jgi:hypothetical protein